MTGRRIGVMGGTFDPIHHGHLVAASEVQARFSLDEVIFVPTGRPWQKDRDQVTHAEHRYLMTVIATASNPRFTVSRVDIDRGGPTYTVDTLTDLHAQRPDDELFFITGADALAAIMGWHDAGRLFELARLIGVTRPGYQLHDPNLPGGAATLIEVPALAISSTACRARVLAGQPVWYLVPDGVVQYIAKHRLYAREPTAGAAAGAAVGARAERETEIVAEVSVGVPTEVSTELSTEVRSADPAEVSTEVTAADPAEVSTEVSTEVPAAVPTSAEGKGNR